MKKQQRLFPFTLLFGGLLAAATVPSVVKANAEEAAGSNFINRVQKDDPSGSVDILTATPWVSDAKFEVALDAVAVESKAYFVVDFEVIQSVNNPEAVMKLGVNGTTFAGPDGVSIHGNPTSVQKQWGNWFFVPVGKTALYLSTADYLSGVTSLTSFGFYFDTGVAGRQVEVKLNGLYLSNTIDVEEGDNFFNGAALSADESNVVTDSKVTAVGITATKVVAHGYYYDFDAVEMTNPLVNSLKLHVKSAAEGFAACAQPDDYGYVTIDVSSAAVTATKTTGLSFQAFAPNGETYFHVYLENTTGNIFAPIVSGGGIETATPFKFGDDGIASTMKAFYNAFYLGDKAIGTAYIPYTAFDPLTHFEGKTIAAGTEIGTLSKIHIGMDMVYGAGRNLIMGAFANVDGEANTITDIFDFTKLSAAEWDVTDITKGTKLTSTDDAAHLANFVIGKTLESDLPGYVAPLNLSVLDKTIADAEALKESDYTAASWKNLSNKLSFAKNIKEHSDLYQQADVDAAASDLRIAINALVKVTSVSSSSTASSTSSNTAGNPSGLNPGAVAGIVIGGVTVIGGLVALIVFLVKRFGKKGA